MVLAEFFIPHGHCYLWKPGLVGLHIVSEALTALAYYSIGLTLVYFVAKRRDVPFNWIFLLFGAFIVSCGTTHSLEIWTLWHPNYWLSGIIKAFTAIVSIYTAFELVSLLPQALALPSTAQLEKEIGERQKAEAALLRQKNHLAQAQKVAHVGSWEFDLATQEIAWSDETFRIYGLAPGQPTPTLTEHQQKIHPEDRRVLDTTVHQLARGKSCELEFRIVCPDGLQAELVERQRIEQELRISEERYRSVVTAMSEGIVLQQADGRITACNASAERILGLEFQQLRECTSVNPCWKTIYEDGSPFPGELHPAMVTLRTGNPQSNVIMGICKPNEPLTWIAINSQPLFHPGDVQPYAVVTSFSDITDRKIAEEALRSLTQQERERALQLEQALIELQRTQSQLVQNEKRVSLGQLVAGVAHEINNPINFIYGNIYVASEYAQDLLHLIELYAKHYTEPVAEISEHIERIELDFVAEDFPKLLASMKEGAHRISEIVHSLRNFSCLDETEYKQVDIHEGIDNTLLILKHRLTQQPFSSFGATPEELAGYDSVLRPEIQVIKEYGELPLIECYPGQLNQVFMNIISNAIDAIVSRLLADAALSENDLQLSHLQPATSWIRIRTEVVDQNSVVVRIADNGPGDFRNFRN